MNFIKNITACKFSLLGSATALFLALAFSYSNMASAQCLVNNLNISTGYDPVAGAVLTPSGGGTADAKWTIAYLSADCLAIGGAIGAPATVIAPNAVWATSTGSTWLSFINSDVYATSPTGNYSMILERKFTTCLSDDITFNIQVANDNWIAALKVDGTTYVAQPIIPPPPGNFNAFTNYAFTIYGVAAGTHVIDVEVDNFPTGSGANGHGLDLEGAISSVNNSIVSESGSCIGYACGCRKTSLTINTGYDPATGTLPAPSGGTGTKDPNWTISSLSADCQTVATANGMPAPIYPAVIVTPYPGIWAIGANSGWLDFFNGNAYPTLWSGTYEMTLQRSFTNCVDDYYDFSVSIADDNSMPYLNVDGTTYVTQAAAPPSWYGSFTTYTFSTPLLYAGTHVIEVKVVSNAITMSSNAHGFDLEGTITSGSGTLSLKSEDAACSGYQCAMGAKTTGVKPLTKAVHGNTLFQNAPNPFTNETVIAYNIENMSQKAGISVCDLTGKVIKKYDIAANGYGTVSFGNTELAPGMYIYSLVVDGKSVATKRMVLTK